MNIQDPKGGVALASAETRAAAQHSYVDWAAIWAGAILAAAITFVLLTFGTAVGLTMVSPYDAGQSLRWLAIAFAIWLLWVQVSSFMAGAYVTGRMRRRAFDATEHEVDVRDATHGLLVWALGTLIGASLAILAAGTTLGGAADRANERAVPTASGSAGAMSVPVAAAMDSLFRPLAEREMPVNDAARAEVGRILARAATGRPVSEDDRTYAARVVAVQTGINDDVAYVRVDRAIVDVRQAADTARKAGIIAAFIATASLAVSAAASMFAARKGGDHRDRQVVIKHFFRGRARTTLASGR